MSVLRELLTKGVELGASDIHLKPFSEPFFRVSGDLVKSEFEVLSPHDMQAIVKDVIPSYLAAKFDASHEADFSLQEEGVGRFRVNMFMAQGLPCAALRHVKTAIPTFEQLQLPTQLRALARMPRGIVLLSGTTGSGKSTTLAAIIGEINRTERRRILTVEDPVEYLFQDDRSVITQREVGLDTDSYTAALKYLLRQDPDVILVGEMRDQESIRTALLAAETGHLVLSTLHAGTCGLAIPRILDMFPSSEQDQIRKGLAGTQLAVVCQRLVPSARGGVVPATEIMINTPTVRKLLEKNQLDVISAAIETGNDDGMHSFNQSIYRLIKSGAVTEADGMRFASNPEALRMNLQGIFLDEGRRILAT